MSSDLRFSELNRHRRRRRWHPKQLIGRGYHDHAAPAAIGPGIEEPAILSDLSCLKGDKGKVFNSVKAVQSPASKKQGEGHVETMILLDVHVQQRRRLNKSISVDSRRYTGFSLQPEKRSKGIQNIPQLAKLHNNAKHASARRIAL